jgi:hypothetical protein
VALARDDADGALERCSRGLDLQRSAGGLPLEASILRLVRAEALHRIGRTAEAHDAIREASERVRRIAATLESARTRQAYLSIDAHARTLELSSAWLTA